ncbi:phosphoribosyltransferase [Sulfolobales archaeon HS-7]|nr:phosphoribosyltransferase [Sulfolobales archaeon HS-7]
MVEYYVPEWEKIEEDIMNAAKKMVDDGYLPTMAIAISTGGLIPAKILADIIGIEKLKFVEVKLYRGISQKENKPTVHAIYIDNVEKEKIIVVDDVSDSGETLETTINAISMFRPTKLKSMTVYVKPWTKLMPDYYAGIIDKWIIFPWDKWEFLREKHDIPINYELRRRYEELLRSKK